jgi:hypothetical protein
LPLGSSFRKGSECTQDRHPCLPLSAVPSPSRSTLQTTPPHATFFRPPPHIPIIISCAAIHLPTTSCRLSESRLLLPSRSGSTADPLHTPTPGHGPYGVHLHVFFRPSDFRRSLDSSPSRRGGTVPVSQSRKHPTCMNRRYVHCSIRSLPNVCTTNPPQSHCPPYGS